MPLTPEDVSNKRFTAVRLREGYDMGEVDQFLDEVEAELTRLVAENDELRAKVEALQGGEPVDLGRVEQAGPAPQTAPVEDTWAEPEQPEVLPELEQAEPEAPEPAPEPEPEPEPPAAAEPRGPVRETIQVTTTADASKAATRLLELAGRNADELVAEAQEQAEEIVGQARAEAQRLEEDSLSTAQSVEEAARTRAEQLDAETSERRTQLFGDLEREKQELDAEVERLKEFERTYRSELKGYFEQQLHALEGHGEAGTLASDEG